MVGLRPVLVWTYALGLCAALVGCGPRERVLIPPKPETPETEVRQVAGPKKIYQLGESFAIQDEETNVIITFSKKRTHDGEEFLKPEENHYWFYLTGTVVNQSTNEFVISPDFYTLTDNKKKTYEPSIRSHAIKGLKVLQGRIPPESRRTASIGFELPKGVRPSSLSFDISNYTACNDSALKPTHFCKPILINLDNEGD